MKPLPLPAVARIQDGHNSLVEPPLNPDWDEAAKIAWLAAVVAHDAALRITLHDEASIVGGKPVPGSYSITTYGSTGRPVSSVSALGYRDAWSYLNGIEIGARAKEAHVGLAEQVGRVRELLEEYGSGFIAASMVLDLLDGEVR